MADMLIKLYDLDDDRRFIAQQKERGISVRKPIGPEKHMIIDWVSKQFSPGWAAETDVATANTPRSCFVAVKATRFIGFACYDATALGYFGPIGVEKSERGKGTGQALLMACLLDMQLKGYGYAIVGDVKNPAYYQKIVGAIEIPDSSPGIYKNRVKNADPAV
ncbi:Acetyltransferase, GNAT family [Olavius sp. associated proteobacterium Delta 1]|nr:Acetyltransferase, GNAT family [Olavius sp. associated proteobacterium Delta 1]